MTEYVTLDVHGNYQASPPSQEKQSEGLWW